MELSVRPDDLADTAAALRRVHASLSQAGADFAATAARLVPQLGPHAALSAGASVSAADQGTALVEQDIATFADGLMTIATYYAALDAHALGRFTVRR